MTESHSYEKHRSTRNRTQKNTTLICTKMNTKQHKHKFGVGLCSHSCFFSVSGFTLMEMVVVLAIFSVTLTMAVNIFMKASSAQSKTIVVQKVASDARYAIERIAEEFKMGIIDYEYYEYYGITLGGEPQDILAIRDVNEEQIIFKKSEEGVDDGYCPDEESKPCLLIGVVEEEVPNWASITSKGTKVKDLKFFIAPPEDPFKPNADGGYENNIQPRVTIVLEAESTGTRPEDKFTITLQTTASSRVYKR